MVLGSRIPGIFAFGPSGLRIWGDWVCEKNIQGAVWILYGFYHKGL